MLSFFARHHKGSSSQTRYFRPELMQLEDRAVPSASGFSMETETVGLTTLQSFLPAFTTTILSFENSLQTAMAGLTTQLSSLNQELNHLQLENYYLIQTIQQLEHMLQNYSPPTSPPQSLSSFVCAYRGVATPTDLQGDITANTSNRVYLVVNADGSGSITVSPFDGTNLQLHFNAGSITYSNGAIGFTYPSGLTSYVQFSFTPSSNGQLTGSLTGHGDWGHNGSFVAFSFPNLTMVPFE